MATVEFYQCDFCKVKIPVTRNGIGEYVKPAKRYGFRFDCSFCGHHTIDLCEKCYNELESYIESKQQEEVNNA